MQELTPAVVAVVLAALFSLAFTLIPGLNAKFAALEDEVKTAIQSGASVLIAIVVYVFACTPALSVGFPVACPTGGVWQLLAIIVACVGVNQGVYKGTPKPAAVKEAKAAAAAAKEAKG